MRQYEILLMLDPELTEERGNEILARVRERVEGDGGTWDGHEPWGRRKLAYEIDHKAEGVYHLLLFTAAPETLAEVSRVLKITDGVVRPPRYLPTMFRDLNGLAIWMAYSIRAVSAGRRI